MTPRQRLLIRELVKKYAENTGTGSLIVYVAETSGMLAAGKAFLHSIDASGSSSADWLLRDCSKHTVDLHSFLEEISLVIGLFDPRQGNEDHFVTLGISPGAGREEIKQAYRTLSRQYHPDTASARHQNNPEKFIEINKAYHALLTAQLLEDGEAKSIPNTQWRKNRARRFSITHSKKIFIWAFGILAILAVLSIVASINIKNRAMLTGLRKGRIGLAASVTPANNPNPQSMPVEAAAETNQETQTDVKQKKINTITSTENPSTAEPIEQKEHINKPPVAHLKIQHFKTKNTPVHTVVNTPEDTHQVKKEIKVVSSVAVRKILREHAKPGEAKQRLCVFYQRPLGVVAVTYRIIVIIRRLAARKSLASISASPGFACSRTGSSIPKQTWTIFPLAIRESSSRPTNHGWKKS